MQKVGSLAMMQPRAWRTSLSGEETICTRPSCRQRADLAMELFLQVRNKVVSAYQEVMRMQV
jgi:flagellar hook-basal body complex protein FliE